MFTYLLDHPWITTAAAALALTALWLILRRRPSAAPNVRELDRRTYIVRVRSIDKRHRRRHGRTITICIGTYAVRQGSRFGQAFIGYNVLGEAHLFGYFDLDTQEARNALAACPPAVAAVAVYPPDQVGPDGRRIQAEAVTGLGLTHKSRQEVDELRHLWEPALKDFLDQITQELGRDGVGAPAEIVMVVSSGGHARVAEEAVRLLRERYPRSLNTVMAGVTVVPHEPAKRRAFAAFVTSLVERSDLDYLLMTCNRIAGRADERHDDAVAHFVGGTIQSTNLANALPDSTVTVDPEDGSRPRTRLLTLEWLQEHIAVQHPQPVGLLARLRGRRQAIIDTVPAVAIIRGHQIAYDVAAGKGNLAGPLALAPDTATTVMVAIPSNSPAEFEQIKERIKTQFDVHGVTDSLRAHLKFARLVVPAGATLAEGVPLAAIRIGEMEGSVEDLARLLRDQTSTPRLAALPAGAQVVDVTPRAAAAVMTPAAAAPSVAIAAESNGRTR